MTGRRVARRAAWFCTAIQLVFSLGPASSLVLCVGANGHVALESAVAEACCSTPRQTTAQIDAAEPCDCTDTPLLRPTIGASGSRADRALAAAAGARSPLSATMPASGPSCPSGRGNLPPPFDGVRVALRSVVLVV